MELDPRLQDNSFDAKVSSVPTVASCYSTKTVDVIQFMSQLTCPFVSANPVWSQGWLGPESERRAPVYKRKVVPPRKDQEEEGKLLRRRHLHLSQLHQVWQWLRTLNLAPPPWTSLYLWSGLSVVYTPPADGTWPHSSAGTCMQWSQRGTGLVSDLKRRVTWA